MANFNKAFNFRGGFQVDTDVLVVRGQNVGIGSSIPNERLVVDGIIQANGLDIRSTEEVRLERAEAGILTVTDTLDVGIETGSNLPYPEGTPQVRLTTGIITAANPAIGVVTYYGDGGRLLNLPTSQWLDIDVGLGFTSIYAQGYVGVNTDDPRYVFQVGGVPFAPKAGFETSQTGVGIETGSIYVSDNISVGKTVSTLGEFIGIGSLITDLNASSIKYGTIGSERYGDINAGIVSAGIVTVRESVTSPVFIGSTFVGDVFTGVAQTAVGVQTTSQLDFDTAVANEFKARDRFISTEGKLQIGDFQNENVGAGASIGDVDVHKFADSSYIYSLSANANAKIFVGKEREGGSRRKYGGLRYGGSLVDGSSETTDLDVVNYDVGNLNFYLHSGSGGINATEGSFRWLYGQSDSVLASLDKNGKFSLTGNSLSGESTLEVAGIATFQDEVFVDGDVTVGGATSVSGDLNVDGVITINGGVEASDDLQFKGATFTGDVLVTDGVGYVSISTVGILTANGEIQVAGNAGAEVRLTNSGEVIANSTIQTNTDVIAQGNIRGTDVEATDRFIGQNNFTVDSDGLAVDNAIIGVATATEFNVDDVTATQITVNNTLTHSSGSVLIDVNGINANAVVAPSIVGAAITVTDRVLVGINTIDTNGARLPVIDSDDITTDSLTATSIGATSITVENLNITGGNLTLPGTDSGDSTFTNIAVSGVTTTQSLEATDATISGFTTDFTAFNAEFTGNVSVGGSITTTDLGILGSFTTEDIQSTTATIPSIVTSELVHPSGSGNDITVDAGLNVAENLEVSGDVNVTGNFNLGATRIDVSPIAATNVTFTFSTDTNDLVISVEISGTQYNVTLPFD